MDKIVIGSVLTAATLAGGGWGAHEYLSQNYAPADKVYVVGAKADYILDIQLENLVRQVAVLEQKKNKTAEEINQLNYLRKQVEDARKVRAK